MRIFVVGVGLFDFAAQTIHREIHLGEVDGLESLFLPINEHAAVAVLQFLAMLLNELRRLHEHAARTARGIEHLAAVRLDDLHHEADDGARREKLAAL